MPTVWSGRGLPSKRLVVDGNWYIDTRAWNRHGPKAGGRWPGGIPIIPDISDDVPIRTTGGLTLTTTTGAALAGDFRSVKP